MIVKYKHVRNDDKRKAQSLERLIKFLAVETDGNNYYIALGKGRRRIGQELYEDLLRWGVEENANY